METSRTEREGTMSQTSTKAVREKSGMDHDRSREVNWGRTGGKETGSGPHT
ncbi:hypothetical protein DY000_02051350 [Brassica cretica]|uniref:Uncharacterized protein n=1 Tax=Brassica cretica TaxID=69181 RepID=A0ABQ7ERS7_BRACR|nr:hypothetical protein DY000_02051350 [Brassica cretica]